MIAIPRTIAGATIAILPRPMRAGDRFAGRREGAAATNPCAKLSRVVKSASRLWASSSLHLSERRASSSSPASGHYLPTALFDEDRLVPCIADRDPTSCVNEKGLRFLTRSATNTYFAQVVRVISLPQAVDELARWIETVWSVLSDCKTVADVQGARKWNPTVKANLEGYSDDQVLATVQSHAGAAQASADAEDPKFAEFTVLASGKPLIGENSASAHLQAETLNATSGIPAAARS